MNDNIVTSLEELGLSQKEARVYLANLVLGPASVQKIADQSGIKRVTTYVILESLVNQGLASQSTKGKKTLFIAEQPTSLRRLLDKKEQVIRDQQAQFDAILPELQTLQNMQTDSPNVKFYDSAEGIRNIMATFLSTHQDDSIDTVYGLSNIDQLHAFFPDIATVGGNPDRIKTKLPSKFIYTTKRGSIYKRHDDTLNREALFVPQEKYPLNGDLSIVGNNIVLLSLTGNKPIGVTIHSAELAKTMKALFDLAWATALGYNE
jgi:Fe2+ or Zn2+ uptake regulation protein